LGIFDRPPFRGQDVKPEREAARGTFVWLMLDWLKYGRIKHLIFSDESRFCRGPDHLRVRVRRDAWNETATITGRKRFRRGSWFRCYWSRIQKHAHPLFEGC
jgi:hypothetical protein